MRARQYVSRLGEQGMVWMEVIPGGRTETSKEVGGPSGMPAALTTGAERATDQKGLPLPRPRLGAWKTPTPE